MFANGIQTIALIKHKTISFSSNKIILNQKFYLNFSGALGTCWSQEFFKTEFTVEIAFLFNETDVLKWTSATTVDTNKMLWAPNASQRRDKWSSVVFKQTHKSLEYSIF